MFLIQVNLAAQDCLAWEEEEEAVQTCTAR